MTKPIVLALLVLVWLPTVELLAQSDKKLPLMSLEFVNFQSTKLRSSGKPVTVGVFRIKNNTDETVQYCDHGGAADFLNQRSVDGEWKSSPWNWCGNGKRPRDLLAGESVYFYIDPEYYRAKYGNKLRFGFFVPDSIPETPSFKWTKMIELPEVDNPDELPYCRFVTPRTKPKNESVADDAKH